MNAFKNVRNLLAFLIFAIMLSPSVGDRASGQSIIELANSLRSVSAEEYVLIEGSMYSPFIADDPLLMYYESHYPSISGDGRYVAYASNAPYLVLNDTNNTQDIFVYDRETKQTELISISSEGEQGNDYSQDPFISANGRFVVFSSHASNLVANDTNSSSDIFFHDRVTKETARVSISSSGEEGNGHSGDPYKAGESSVYHIPTVSGDGRFVAFDSEASNLVMNDTNQNSDIFLHDRITGETTHVSVSSAGEQADGYCFDANISEDGRYIVYESAASNLVPGYSTAFYIYLYDRITGQTSVISKPSDGGQSNGDSLAPSISADGRYIAFSSFARNLIPDFIGNGFRQIYVHDRTTGINTLVSQSTTGEQGNSPSIEPSISADGQFVAFLSDAYNLVPDDTSYLRDTFVHNRLTGDTTRVSVSSDGEQANSYSYFTTSISSDGRYIAFRSGANNLVPEYTEDVNVFVHDQLTKETTRVSVPLKKYTISGTITDSTGNPIPDVTIENSSGHITLTASDGSYTFADLLPGTYTLTPSKISYIFTPSILTVNLTSDKSEQYFIGQQVSCVPPDITTGILQTFNYQCTIPFKQHFLELPFHYNGDKEFEDRLKRFDVSGQDYEVGKVGSFFDHDKPTYSKEGEAILLYDGREYSKENNKVTNTKLGCYDEWCYNGHNGIDFGISGDVLAAADGVVVEACKLINPKETCKGDDYICLGNYVVIYHENGYFTLYAHLENIDDGIYFDKDKPLKRVYSNDIERTRIGKAGETGKCADGVHLHFQTFYDLDGKKTYTVDEVTDPFGWSPFDTSEFQDGDPWKTPSLRLWRLPGGEAAGIGQEGGTISTPGSTASYTRLPNPLAKYQIFSISPSSSPGSWFNNLFWLKNAITVKVIPSSPMPVTTEKIISDTEDITATSELTARLTINFNNQNLRHIHIDQLKIYFWNEIEKNWIPLNTTLNYDFNQATTETELLGTFDLLAPFLCEEDQYQEPDDSYHSANELFQSQLIRFDVADDEDWFSLQANPSQNYSFVTKNRSNGVIPIIEVYDTDGITLLVSNENAPIDEVIWNPISEGVYYIRIIPHEGSSYGCASSFDLSYSDEPIINIPTPFINAINPSGTVPGIGNLELLVRGFNFYTEAAVLFDGEPLETTFVTNEKLLAIIPGEKLINSGLRVITVVNQPLAPIPSNQITLFVSEYQPANSSTALTRRPLFQWPEVSGATSYQVQIATVSSFSTLFLSQTSSTPSLTPSKDLPLNKTIYWRVRAKVNGVYQPWSTRYSFRSANPPSNPTLRSPANNALTTNYVPKLTWSQSSLPSGTTFEEYQLQVARDKGFTDLAFERLLTNRTAPSYTVLAGELLPNTTYYWRVRSSNTLGHTSNWSKPFTLRAAMLPTTLTVPAEASTAVTPRPTLEWTTIEGADNYSIQVSLYSNFSELFLSAKPTGTTYAPTKNLPNNRTIFWRVRGNGVNGPSLWSKGSFKSANPPSTPALVSPANSALNTDYMPRLSWRASSLPSGTTFQHYRLQVAKDSAFTQDLQEKLITSRTAPFYQFEEAEKLYPDTRYYWRVQAWNTAGHYSTWSAVRYFRTAMVKPTLLAPAEGSTVTVRRPDFEWTPDAGATSYTIQLSAYSNFSTLIRSATPADPTWTSTVSLPQNKTIYWRVRANGANGPSLWAVGTFKSANPPSTPTLVSPSNGAVLKTLTPKLDWSNSSLPAGTIFKHYQLQVATNTAFTDVITHTITDRLSSEWNDWASFDPLQPKTKYYWRVRAVNADGHESNWSSRWSFTTP